MAKVVDNILITNISPVTLYSARKRVYQNSTSEMKNMYVVCTKCNALYNQEELMETVSKANTSSREQLIKCSVVAFPNHRQLSRRRKCESDLLKLTHVGKKWKFVPFKQCVYNGVTSTLQRFLNRSSFIQLCQHWRKRPTVPDGMLYDVYDGQLWKKWTTFLQDQANFLVMLNVDWFRPHSIQCRCNIPCHSKPSSLCSIST